MRALLDVGVLIALLDPGHVHHERASTWGENGGLRSGWASCAITENGVVRITSQAAYPNSMELQTSARLLAASKLEGDHKFWPCDISLTDPAHIDLTRLHGHRQVTDVYLLALAVAHGGRFVTLDQRISLGAVPGATPEHLVVV